MTRSTHDPRPGRTALSATSTADRRSWHALLVSSVLVAAAALLLAGPAVSQYATNAPQSPQITGEESLDAYGFVRRVEGEVLLAGLEQDDAVDAEINHPLLTGDRIEASSGRVELVLPDGSVVRVERGTTVVFDALAGSPDSEIDGGTVLVLEQGVLQVRTPEAFYGGDEFAIETPNADIYIGAGGSYRIKARGASFTEVTVREGFAEAATERGSTVAREGEALEVTGYNRPFVDVVAAGPADDLEYWAKDLDRDAFRREDEYVDPRLAYAAAPLYDSGEWMVVDSHRVWRPYVRADWRPFHNGRWVYTPSGLTWVSSARWGWVTSHYGTWDLVPGYGWLWYPGAYYQPASVYWYWGPTYVGWVPYGYYARHYGPRYGPRYAYGVHGWSVFGWAGGDWGFWADWTFCPTRYFGRRGYDRYWDTGRNLASTRRFAVPRGIVTSDTRGLTRDRWGKPNDVFETLVRRHPDRGGRDLPDVTDFVARRKLSEARLHELEVDRAASVKERLRPLDENRRSRFASGKTQRTITRDAGGREINGRGGARDSGRVGGNDSSSRRVTIGGTAGVRGGGGASGGSRASGASGARRVDAGETTRERGTREGSRSGDTRDLSRDRDRDEASDRVRGRSRDESERPLRYERPDARDGGSALRGESSEEAAPARRVLDRIRAYRESGQSSGSAGRSPVSDGSDGSAGSDNSSSSRRSGSATNDRSSRSRSGSSARPSSSSSSSRSGSSRVQRNSGSSSSKGSSGSSARGSSGKSSSSRSSARKSSPPPRRSSGASSGRSGGGSRSRVKRPNG